MVTVKYKINNLQEIFGTYTPNEEYENFVNALMEAAAEYILTKPRAEHKVPWETLVFREK